MTTLRPSLLLAVLLGSACVEKLDVVEENRLPCEVERILAQSCALSGCHAPMAQAPDLSEGNAASSIGAQSAAGIPHVTIGNLAESYIAVKIMDPPPAGAPDRMGSLMPMPPDLLTETDRAILVGWMAGALESTPACGDGATGPDVTAGTETGEATTTGGPEPVACGLTDLDKGGTIKTIDEGDGVGQIPTEIGTILKDNCGCHYTDTVMSPPFLAYAGMLDMTNLAGFSADIPAGAASTVVKNRLLGMGPIMPMAPCLHESGEKMDPALRDRLIEWIDAGTPDGATWTPGG